MTRPQWWLDETALDVLALCEHLSDRLSPNPDFLDDFTAPSGIDPRQLISIAESDHLLRSDGGWADSGHVYDPVVIMPSGLRRLATVRDHRERPSERTNAARQGLLLWAYEHGMKSADLPMNDPVRFLHASPPYNFWGEPFTETNVVEATDYLLDAGLLDLYGQRLANGRAQNVQVTRAGKDCVENFDGLVGAYLNRGRHSAPSSTVTNSQHFHGDFTGQNAQGENITQTQHVSVDPEALAAIFSSLRDVVAQVADGSEDRSDLELAIEDLEREVRQPSVDPAQVSKRIGLLRRTADRIGNTAVTVGTTAATSGLIDLLGNVIS